MDISVVINCSNDFHVFKTIESVDEDVEIICSITPNTKIEKKLREMKISYIVTDIGSQSKTTNAGISLVTNNKFILMDSDCYFEKGVISRMCLLLDEHFVVNANIIFDYEQNCLSKAIARCKTFDDTYEGFAHKPGLGLRKDILKSIGGYWFNEILSWAEDSELSYRLNKAGVNIFHYNIESIHHLPTSYKHNLRSCFRYGGGDSLRHRLLSQTDDFSLINKYRNILRYFTPFETLVMITNDVSYQLGYICKFLQYRSLSK